MHAGTHSFITAALASSIMLLSAGPCHGELSPDWIAELPVGNALSAGLAGMVTDANGVSYITGTNGSSSNTNILTTAIAPDGTMIWQDVFNGSANWHDQARGICMGPDGVVYVTGNTPGPNNYSQVLLLKYSAASGELLDTVQYSSALFTSEYGAAVATDAQANVYIGGGTVGDGADGLIMSFDPGGDFRWSTTYDGPASAPYSQDQIQQLAVDQNGNVIAMIYGVMSSLHADYVVTKYSGADGAVIWQATWGVFGSDAPSDMAIDATGDVYVTGTGLNGINMYSTIKLDGTDGQLLWQEYDSIGGEDVARAVALDGLGGVYITGSSDPDGNQSNFNENFYTVKRDAASGAQLWTHFYGDNCVGCYDVSGDVIVDQGGNVLVVGSTSSPPYLNDMILFVLDSQTGLELDRSVVGTDTSVSLGGGILRLDTAQNIYIGGGSTNYDTGALAMAVFKYASLVEVIGSCPGDINEDGQVDVADLLEVLAAWGSCTGCPADLDENGQVDVTDLLQILDGWGGC